MIFDLLVANAKAYENQIDPYIQAISSCQDLALDQMAFIIVKQLAETTESPIDHNQNVARWLLNLTDFASQFFRKFTNVDIVGLFTFLINDLRTKPDDNCSFVKSYMAH